MPGPNSVISNNFQTAGGWDYALESVKFLSSLNPDCFFNVVFSHLEDFGLVPTLPVYTNVKISVLYFRKSDLGLKYPDQPSSQHGALLNAALKCFPIETKYYGIFDPDCYIALPWAVSKILTHMDLNDLGIVGCSYPSTLPKTYYWDFPTVYFQIMDSRVCPPSALDCLPDETQFTGKTLQPGGHRANPEITSPKLTITKYFKRLFFKLLLIVGTRDSRYSFLVSHFLLNYPHRNSGLLRDTGWANRALFKDSKIEVFPHAVKPLRLSFGFDESAYKQRNLDVALSGINATWHYLTNGIYESRDPGRQKFRFRALRKVIGDSMVAPSEHPATSIKMIDSTLFNLEVPMGWGKMQNAFEYAWREDILCFHLGHGGKNNETNDILRLEAILEGILKKWSL